MIDQIKFVVGNQEDLEFTRQEIEKNLSRSPQVIVSPILNLKKKNTQFLQEVWNFCLEYRVRWSLQQHKIVFGNKKGV